MPKAQPDGADAPANIQPSLVRPSFLSLPEVAHGLIASFLPDGNMCCQVVNGGRDKSDKCKEREGNLHDSMLLEGTLKCVAHLLSFFFD